MVSASQIREQLALFLSQNLSLDAFEDWFVQNTWNIHKSGSVAAEDVTFAIQESLAEYSSQHLNEQELYNELARILHADTKVVDVAPQPVFRLSSASPVRLVSVAA